VADGEAGSASTEHRRGVRGGADAALDSPGGGSGEVPLFRAEPTTTVTTTMTTFRLPDTLVTPPGRAYGSQVRFHPLASAPFVWRALTAHDGSSSSHLTSTNVSLLTAPQLDTLKVARNMAAHVALSEKPVPTGPVLVTGLSQPVRDTRVWNDTRWNHYR